MASLRTSRLPYFIDKCLWSNEFCVATICTDGPSFSDSRSGQFADGLPLDFIKFFIEHGNCALCGSPIEENFGRCKCGEPSRESRHLEIKFPSTLYISHFKKHYQREKNRIGSIRRTKTLKEAGGTFDKKHIKGMHQAQRGLCYFCGTPIELGSKSLHADHYVPIAQGGRNDLHNMVLTCASCNLTKNATSGDWFDHLSRKNRTPEFAAVLRAIRKDLKAYKAAAHPS
jgi:5-methylcytosine-specific restriction endonuclease McrA